MKKRISILLILIFIFTGAALYAQEESTEESFEFDTTEESFGFEDSAFTMDEGGSDAAPALAWKGELKYAGRYDFDYDTPLDSALTSMPMLKLGLSFENSYSELYAELKVDENILDISSLLSEAYIRLFYDFVDIEAGLLKVVWGTGDGGHVVDVLNSNNYSDFINQDYLDRRIASPMLKLNFALGMDGMLEVAYLPILKPDVYPFSGSWAPAQITAMYDQVYQQFYDSYSLVNRPGLWQTVYDQTFAATANATIATNAADAALEEFTTQQMTGIMGNVAISSFLPDTATLSYGQYAAHLTGSVSGFDYGLTYYYGFLKKPAFDMANQTASFNRVHTIGLEGATALGPLNIRAEAAYNITEDLDGDDPLVYNNTLEYLAGFDVDIPVSSLNLNAQLVGSYIINSDNIGASDMEYKTSGIYTSNTVAVSLSDSYNHEKIKPRVTWVYNFENQDWMLQPELAFTLVDDVQLKVLYKMFEGDAGTNFGQFTDRDFGELNVTYSF